MTPKTAYIVYSQQDYESPDDYFVCLDKETAERAVREINDFKEALREIGGQRPQDTNSHEWDAWNDKCLELRTEANWPYGVNMGPSFFENATFRELPLISP
jgi:DNA-binding transcriptional regulator GbsR (MarR family)